jgi:hypothetical protein
MAERIPGDFQVRNPEAEKVLNDIGNMMRAAMPLGYGFVLLMVEFGEKGGCFYTSNIRREDVCNTLREFIQKNEPN